MPKKPSNATFSTNTSGGKPYTPSGQFPDKHRGGSVLKKAHAMYTKTGQFKNTETDSTPKDAPWHHNPSEPNLRPNMKPVTPSGYVKKAAAKAARRTKKRTTYSASALTAAKARFGTARTSSVNAN